MAAAANWVMLTGWGFDILATVWIALLLLQLLTGWLVSAQAPSRPWFTALLAAPVNVVRRLVPTVYRGVDFAPWLTLIVLVLMKTFLFRAMIYWGLLHRA